MDVQLKRGLLDICVLAAIKDEESYGYQIVKDMKPYVDISESTLYPILRRLETAELLTVRSAEHNGRLRKYYRITDAGLARIHAFTPAGVVDLAALARAKGIQAQGLRTLSANLLGFRISKSAQCSNWENRELSAQQVKYAATDAWVGRELYFHLI